MRFQTLSHTAFPTIKTRVVKRMNTALKIYPHLDFPMISVTTTLPGANAEIVDSSITGIIESAVNSTPGIEHIMSRSSSGVSYSFYWRRIPILHLASRARKYRSRLGNYKTHWRTGTWGKTWSTRWAAVSTIRRALQEGQMPRPLQE